MTATLILADDLSGAADCAVTCASGGAETLVLVAADAEPGGAEALAVDVNSRAMSAGDAAAAMAAAAARFMNPRTGILYHKMDSTLRGHWPLELASLLEAAARIMGRRPFGIVAPAFPGVGRTLVDGRLLVDGAPPARSEIPAWERDGGSANVPAALAAIGLDVEPIPLRQIRRGPDELAEVLAAGMASGRDAAVCDAEEPRDLDVVARAALKLPGMPLFVGSAGLMRALGEARGSGAPSRLHPIRMTKPVVIVVGSASEVSRGQFRALAADPSVASFTVAPTLLRRRSASDEIRALGEALDAALASNRDIAIATDWSEGTDLGEGQELSAALAEIVAPRLRHAGALVATGGETARAILWRCGVKALRVLGEMEAGVPVSVAAGDPSIPVVTKAGAFGDRGTLSRCRDALRGDDPGVAATP